MEHLILVIVAIAAGTGALVTAFLVRHHRSSAPTEEPVSRSPLVRVLTTDEALRDAVQRAAAFERMVAASLETRTRRYEAMIQPAPVTEIGVSPRPVATLPDDEAPRSA